MGNQSPASGGNDPLENLQNFQFTFNVSATNSEKSSFIEPDPNLKPSSSSLSESVLNFPVEFGRTYHAYRAGSYAFPNDMIERDRLNVQNEALFKLFEGRLFFAPLSQIPPPRIILDIATGLGDWAIQMGDLFPHSEIIGTDLSPIQPQDVPPNVNFYVEDSSEPWNYSEPFDFIHTRATGGSWSCFETEIAQQAFDNLSPGGYFESQEFDSVPSCDDDTLKEDSPLSRWLREVTVAAEMCNRPLVLGRILKEVYQRVGFVDVKERIFKMPINSWPRDEALKELGGMWERNFQLGLSGFCVSLFNRAYGRTPAETEVSLVDVRRDLLNPQIHAYISIYVVWGRKPHPGEMLNSAKDRP